MRESLKWNKAIIYIHMCICAHMDIHSILDHFLPLVLSASLSHMHTSVREQGWWSDIALSASPMLIIKCWSTDAWVYFGFLSFCLDFFLIRLFHWYLSGSIMWLIDLLFHLFSIPFFHFRCWALIAVMWSAPVHWTPEPVRCCMLHWL